MVKIKRKINKKSKYTFEICKEEALICSTRTDFSKKFPQAYKIALSNNWLNKICVHMKNPKNKFNKNL